MIVVYLGLGAVIGLWVVALVLVISRDNDSF